MRSLSVRHSLVLSFAQKYTDLALTIPTLMILSRLLTPAEVGVFSVAMAVIALIQMLRDFGVTQFVVQHANTDEAVLRSAFTINLIFASALGVALWLASRSIGAFYDEPGVTHVLQVIAASFFVIPFGSVIKAMLRREMAFGALYKITTSEGLVRSGSAIGLASAGWGYMSLAWANLAAMVASALACSVWGAAYRTRGVSLAHWREITRFGVARVSGDMAAQIGLRSSDIIIGRVLGMSAAGLYSRGYGLVNMFRENVIGAINAVAFPTFAEHHRNRTPVNATFLQSLTFLTGLSWPFFTFAILMAFPIMRVMFGAQWDAAVPLLQWLAAAAMVGTLIFQCNHFFTAIGRVGVATKNEIVFQSLRVAIVLVAAYQGLWVVAASQVLVYGIAVVIYYIDLKRIAVITFRQTIAAVLPSLAVTIASGLGPALVFVFDTPRPGNIWSPLLLSGVSALAGWLAGAFAAGHPLWLEIHRFTARLRSRRMAY